MVIMGSTLAEQILDTLRVRVYRLKEKHNITPHVAVIRVGEDPAITSYINQKKKMATAIGAILSVYQFPPDVTKKQLLETIHFLQEKGDIHGIILQLPLPPHINGDELIMEINPEKDIDGFHPNSPFTVPLAAAVMTILESIYTNHLYQENISFITWLKKQSIVVLGKGKTAGGPVITLLQKLSIPLKTIDSKTTNREALLKKADVVISATGKPNLIKSSDIKQDAILIGIGLSRGEDEKLHGEYEQEDIENIASFYTPTPRGVGPVNVAKLMENLVLATERSLTKKQLQ